MPDLKGLENVQFVMAFIVPGLIISYVRARFTNGRMEKLSDAALAYFALAVVYYGLTLPLLYYIIEVPAGLLKNICWWALIAVGPSLFGMLLGVSTQQGWLRRLAHKLGMRPIHSTPNAWDWRFGACPPCFVLVTLANGDTVAGLFGEASFASSDPAERDIYIEEIWDVPDDGDAWIRREERQGILLPAKEVRHVQFWS
jgi:hypothetical protein